MLEVENRLLFETIGERAAQYGYSAAIEELRRVREQVREEYENIDTSGG